MQAPPSCRANYKRSRSLTRRPPSIPIPDRVIPHVSESQNPSARLEMSSLGQISSQCALQRTRTWPLRATKSSRALATTAMSSSQGHDESATAAYKQPSSNPSDGEEDIDANPAQHFLSPVHTYEYDHWSDDSDDDTGSIEWDAGITDFALFDHDRREARDTGASLPEKWHDLMSNQESALQRSITRSQAWCEPNAVAGNHDRSESLPELTPDASPHMDELDDLEPAKSPELTLPIIHVSPPMPVHSKVTAAEIENAMNDFYDSDDEDGLVLSFHPTRQENVMAPQRRPKLQRPGLAKNRTLSGRAHSWKRPGLHIGTVMEKPREEHEAEHEDLVSSMLAPSTTASDVVPIEDEPDDARWLRRGAVQFSANDLSHLT